MKDTILTIVRKPLFWAILAIAALLTVTTAQRSAIVDQKADISRYQANHESLLKDLQFYELENGNLAATVQALTLRGEEMEALIPAYKSEISQLKLKVEDLQSVAHLNTVTEASVLAPIDAIRTPQEPGEYEDAQVSETDKPHSFQYTDDYITINGIIDGNQVQVNVEHRDSLTLIAHRKSNKCLFRRKGKIIGYNVTSRSPYTKITDVEYIELTE